MRKYTVYEIEKLTKGKLSKYKLNQAILKGQLKAERVYLHKRGRGTPKYYVYEEDLLNYLREISEERKHKISIIEHAEVNNSYDKVRDVVEKVLSEKDQAFLSHTNEISELRQRIRMLESTQSSLSSNPLDQVLEKDIFNSSYDNDLKKSEIRKNLLSELEETSVYAIHKRRRILQELNRLA